MLERGEEEAPDAVRHRPCTPPRASSTPHLYLAGVEEDLPPHLSRNDEDTGDPARAAENTRHASRKSGA